MERNQFNRYSSEHNKNSHENRKIPGGESKIFKGIARAVGLGPHIEWAEMQFSMQCKATELEKEERLRQEEMQQYYYQSEQQRQALIGEYLHETAARPTSKMEYALWVATMMQQGEEISHDYNYALFGESNIKINENGAAERISPANSMWTPRCSSDSQMIAAYGSGAYRLLHYPNYVELNREPGCDIGRRKDVDHRPGHEIGHGSIYTLRFNDNGTATASHNKEHLLQMYTDIKEIISSMTYEDYRREIRNLRTHIEQETAVYRKNDLHDE